MERFYSITHTSEVLIIQRKLSKDVNGNILDYYFAIAFTVKQTNIIKFQISGDFVDSEMPKGRVAGVSNQ